MDGNKRIVFAATYTFLAINGWRLTAEPEATYTFMLGLYESAGFHFEALVSWLRLNTHRVR